MNACWANLLLHPSNGVITGGKVVAIYGSNREGADQDGCVVVPAGDVTSYGDDRREVA